MSVVIGWWWQQTMTTKQTILFMACVNRFSIQIFKEKTVYSVRYFVEYKTDNKTAFH